VTYTTGYTQPARLPAWNPDALKSKDADKDPKYLAENKVLADRAVEAAKQADLVIYVGGYCHQSFGDDENLDRPDMALPGLQNELIERLATANPRLVVTLVSGGPITMPWLDKVPSLMQAWYGGCEAGNALASVLFGDVNPSGKLPCTFPKALKDVPAHQNEPRTYPGVDGTVHYDEGLLVGYRWFDTKKVEPLFPFGFGLSYTTFTYGNLKVTGEGTPSATIECEVTNTGSREGAEVVQLYVQPKKPSVLRPEKELKGFAKVSLKPGETKKVSLSLDGRSFAYYEPTKKGWVAEKGEYGILVGASSRDIRLTGIYKVAKTTMQ
jgi:beta-glucosidase